MKVADRSGVRWKVKRRWLPWRRALRMPESSGGAGDASDLFEVPVIGPVLLVLFVIIAIPFVILFAVVFAEIVLLLLLVPVVVLARTLVGGHWPIEVWRAGELVGVENIKGWTASKARMDEIVAGIATAPFVPPPQPPAFGTYGDDDPYQVGPEHQRRAAATKRRPRDGESAQS